MAPNIPRLNEARPDAAFFAICAATAVLTGIGFGLAPALQCSGSQFVHGPASAGSGGKRWRDALVVGQLALSTVLLVGAALLLRSLERLDALDPGFRPENVLTARIDMTSETYSTSAEPGPNRPQLAFARILAQVTALPGVIAAGGANRLPLAGEGEGDILAIEGRPADGALRGGGRAVTPDYFRAIGERQLRGRNFSETDTDRSEAVAIVNDVAAGRYWPGLDPIGRRMAVVNPRFPSPEPHWMKVVGVVAAVRHEGLDRAPRPQYYIPYLRGEWRSPYLVVRAAGDPMGIGPTLRRTVAAVDGNAVVTDLVSMDSLVSASSAPLRFRARLLGAFAFLALLLAAAGTYGVMSCMVEQRTAEIGVRMAVGADTGDIFAMVLGRGAALAGTGLVIGVFGGLMLRRVMTTLLFETEVTDPVALTAAVALLLLAALGACGAPSVRAARLDPLVALRQDR